MATEGSGALQSDGRRPRAGLSQSLSSEDIVTIKAEENPTQTGREAGQVQGAGWREGFG